MAPVEADLTDTENWRPILRFAWRTGFVLFCTNTIYDTIKHAQSSLPPAVDTRLRRAKRKRDLTIYTFLTGLSFAIASYFAIYRRVLSYEVWAHENNHASNALWERIGEWGGWYANPHEHTHMILNRELHLGRWAQDVSLDKEWAELALSTTRGFWWTLSYYLGLTTWSLFVGIEARARNIPKKTTFCLLLLATFFSLSTAQNLFSILLLLTPIPLGSREEVADLRSPRWTPHPIGLVVFAVLSLLLNLFRPAFAQVLPEQSPVHHIVSIQPFLFALAIQNVPMALGKLHRNPHQANRSYAKVFSAIAITSTVLYAMMTVFALFENAPDAHYKRHSYVWNMHQTTKRTVTEQIRLSVVRVLSMLHWHPIVGGVAWDVVLSVLSLTSWTLARDLDPAAVLKNSVAPWLKFDRAEEKKHVEFHHEEEEEPALVDATPLPAQSPVKRGRGRPRKNAVAPVEPATSANALRRNTRNTRAHQEDDSEADDDYVPPAKTQALVDRMSLEDEHEETATEEAEAAALGLGLFVLGGLGSMMAGTLGAEVTGA